MRESYTFDFTLTVRSSLPGRVRWHVPLLRNLPRLADAVAIDLEAQPGVIAAEVNPTTGSLLLRFDPEHGLDEAAGWVRGAIERQATAATASTTPMSALQIRAPKRSATPPSPLIRLFAATEKYPALRRETLVASAADGLADAFPPLLVGLAVDTVTRGSASILGGLGLGTVASRLFALGGFGVAFWGLAAIFEYWKERTSGELANRVRHDLRNQLYDHVQTLDISTIESRDVSNWMAVLDHDVDQVYDFIKQGAEPSFAIASNALIVSTTFLIASPVLGVAQLMVIPPLVLASMAMLTPMRNRLLGARDDAERLTALVTGNVSGMSTIASFNAQDREAVRVLEASEQHLDSARFAHKLEAAYVPTLRSIVGAGFVTTLVWGGWQVTRGALSAGALDTMAYSQLRFMAALARLGISQESYQRTGAALERIYATLDMRPSLTSGKRPLLPTKVVGEIAFENVFFGYELDRPVLNGLTMRCPAGRMTGIVGATGAGKSTLLKLILRFYDVSSGHVAIDGIDVRDVKLDDLRQTIAMVSQQVTLFNGSIRDNIAYARPDASQAEVVEAARIAEAKEFIEALPQQYESQIGFGGLSLSGGQRQRIAIARAILANRPILLFDEATSSLDYATEAALQRSLVIATKNRTTVIVAHRLSTIRSADIIYVMDDGQIREAGRHDDLIEADGIYASMWRVQTGETPASKPGDDGASGPRRPPRIN